jgi:hypothetical protein
MSSLKDQACQQLHNTTSNTTEVRNSVQSIKNQKQLRPTTVNLDLKDIALGGIFDLSMVG